MPNLVSTNFQKIVQKFRLMYVVYSLLLSYNNFLRQVRLRASDWSKVTLEAS